jgi:hypothetical protein
MRVYEIYFSRGQLMRQFRARQEATGRGLDVHSKRDAVKVRRGSLQHQRIHVALRDDFALVMAQMFRQLRQ